MAIKLGTNNISNIYVGAGMRVVKIYNGSGATIYEYAEPTPSTGYNITYNITNGTASGPATVNSNGTATITVTPDEGYTYSSTGNITIQPAVTNATTDSFDPSTGVLVISNPTGDVTVTYEYKYRVTIHFSITNGHVKDGNGNTITEITRAAGSDIMTGPKFYVYADSGYVIPILSGNATDSITYSGITPMNENIAVNSNTGVINASVTLPQTSTDMPHDVYVSYTCKPRTDLAGRTFQLPDGGTPTIDEYSSSYTYTALDIMFAYWFFTKDLYEYTTSRSIAPGNFTSNGYTYDGFSYESVETGTSTKTTTYSNKCNYTTTSGTVTEVLSWTSTGTNKFGNASWAAQAYRTIKFGTGTPIYDETIEAFLKACATEVV